MAQKIRLPKKSSMISKRSVQFMEDIKSRILSGSHKGYADILSDFFSTMRDFFSNLGKPTMQVRELDPKGPRLRISYNDTMSEIGRDLEVAFSEAGNLNKSISQEFNYAQTLKKNLEFKIKATTSRSVDLKILNDEFREDFIIAGDDFLDTSKIDSDLNHEFEPAELPLNQGAVMLRRTGNENKINDQTDINIINKKARHYEGHFYSFAGEAFPEGGRWHLETVVSVKDRKRGKGTPNKLSKKYRRWKARKIAQLRRFIRRVAPGSSVSAKALFREWTRNRLITKGIRKGKYSSRLEKILVGEARRHGLENPRKVVRGALPDIFKRFGKREADMIFNNWHLSSNNIEVQDGTRRTKKTVGIENMKVIERGASEDELDSIRRNMIDGNPDTFWQIEYVIGLPKKFVKFAKGVGRHGHLKRTRPSRKRLERQLRRSYDRRDSRITISIDLKEPTRINWINIIPHNFDSENWLEIKDIRTKNGDEVAVSLPGFRNGRYENVLTDEANEELTPEERAVVMTPNKYKYAGQGVWTFPTRMADTILIDVMQRVPTLTPYQKMRIQMQRVKTKITTVSKSKSEGGIFGAIKSLF